MGFYDNHVTVELCKNAGVKDRYICYLSGTKIGQIMIIRDEQKPYEARIEDGSSYFGQCLGCFSTLFAAKNRLLEPGKRYLKEAVKTPVSFLPSADHEFYPTPSDVAGKLFAGVKWRSVKSILEPSAGKGDLCDFTKNIRIGKRRSLYGDTSYRLKDTNVEFDCIEIDENLRHILTGKGYRVVHDDFLTFTTYKRYDLILMNPPFSVGDLHLLHAIDLVRNGGQIACILNAETLRNPYTKTRMTLMKELKRYKAQIRYVKDAFKNAERKAVVDIAIINICIPSAEPDTSIYDNLKKAKQQEGDVVIEKEIAPSNTVERLIREYDVLCSVGIDLMQKYNGVTKYITCGEDKYSTPMIMLSIAGHAEPHCGPEEINRFLTNARLYYWQRLFDIPELRERMTSSMQSEYSDIVRTMKDYEFSEFNIRQVIKRIMSQLGEGVEEAIMKCFDKLSNEHTYHEDIENDNIHYFNGWKTNKVHYVNRKCIIPTWGCFAREYKPDKHGRYKDVYTDIDPHGCFAVLGDLEKALDYLDKGETPRVNMEWRLEAAAKEGRTSVACKYFNVKFYKKGTCHIEFYDQKVLDRLNIFAARKRMWLPPTYGKVHYKDMDDESKRVVDEFMGQERYETVMQNPNDYLLDSSSMVPLLGEI